LYIQNPQAVTQQQQHPKIITIANFHITSMIPDPKAKKAMLTLTLALYLGIGISF
jgi:hypothetical protein